MVELKRDEYNRVLHLLKNLDGVCLFARAVVENSQSGRIFVNNEIDPRSCLITSAGGAYLVAGEESDIEFNDLLFKFLKDKSHHTKYFDLYTSSRKWLEVISSMLNGYVVKLPRSIYHFNCNDAKLLSDWNSKIPTNYTLKLMDENLYEMFVREMQPSYKSTWGTFREFSLKGFGYCLLNENKLASVCTSEYISGGYAGIDITTKREYRGQGLAFITCSAFIEHCLQNKLIPMWNADSGNEPSNKLAAKLRFNKIKGLEMLWWHENTDVIKSYLKKFNYN